MKAYFVSIHFVRVTVIVWLATFSTCCAGGFHSTPESQYDSIGKRKMRKRKFSSTSILAVTGGAELAGITINVFVAPRISCNAGVGLWGDWHVGSNIYLTPRAGIFSLTAYTGVQITRINKFDPLGFVDVHIRERKAQWGSHIPFGMEFIGMKGFTLQVEAGPNFQNKKYKQLNLYDVIGAVRLGYSFPWR